MRSQEISQYVKIKNTIVRLHVYIIVERRIISVSNEISYYAIDGMIRYHIL